MIDALNAIMIRLLIYMQFLDGTFTYLGVINEGVNIEANPIIKNAILNFGPFPALFALKTIAIIILVLIYQHRVKICECRLFPFIGFVFLCYVYAVTGWTLYFLELV